MGKQDELSSQVESSSLPKGESGAQGGAASPPFQRQAGVVGLILCGTLVLLPFLFSFSADGGVSLVGSWQLPPLCMSQALLGMDCPGCGMSRSFIALTRGNWAQSVAYHRLGPVLYVFLAYQAFFYAFGLWRPGSRAVSWLAAKQKPALWFVVALMLLNWVVGFWIGGNGG